MSQLKGKNILVTGGAGFIGSNLIEYLLNNENQVTCLDNFSTGKPENLDAFSKNPLFTMIEGDIRNLEDCRKAVTGCDLVYHQAALGSVPRSIKDPITTNEVNIGGFLNMLTASRDEKVQRFIYAASSSTYGDHPGLPKYEDRIGRPLSPYAVTKYVNELYANVFADLYGLETIGLRYFNVFGRKQDPNGAYAAAIPKFIKLLINHQSPVVYGDGEQSRDFTYIDNVIQANELAGLVTGPEAVNQVYNVAFGEKTTVNQLIDYLREGLSQFDSHILTIPTEYTSIRKGDILHSLASVEKAERLLGYRPQYNLRNGIKKAIEWYFHSLK